MNKRLAEICFRWLKIDPVPAIPAGADSTTVVRMSRRLYQYALGSFFLKQTLALIFLLIFFNVGWFVRNLDVLGVFTFVELGERMQNGVFGFLSRNVYDESTWPVNPFSAGAIRVYEWLGLTLFFIQAAITFLPIWLRLNYHSTWYLVERDRIRAYTGLWTRREQTTRFANIQALNLKRNVLQTFLGISTVELRTAGGGGGKEEEEKSSSNRILRLKDIDNGSEIADLIRQRMLDPDSEPVAPPSSLPQGGGESAVLAAAQQLLVEAKSLRRELQPAGSSDA